jgi:hypothetical protein
VFPAFFLGKDAAIPNFFSLTEKRLNRSAYLCSEFFLIWHFIDHFSKSCFMNKQLLLTFSFLFFSFIKILAQVAPPCPTPPPPGAESCPAACVYCDFDGYMGINNGTPSGGNTVCGQIFLHNDQWFGFVAGTQCITINIATSNCQDGNGLQAAFFENCQDDAIACNGGSPGGAGQPLELTYCGFVPGQTYYLMVDGWTGDVCDFEIEVLDGSVTPPAPEQPSPPQGPTQVCPGATVVYTVDEVPGAGYYQWTTPAGSQINGAGNNVTLPAPDGVTVTVTFGNLGGNVCVRVGNACFAPLQACLPVTNQPIPVTVKPDLIVCYEDLPYIWDEQPFTIINSPGNYILNSTPYDSYLGCDSTVRQTIRAKGAITTNIGIKYLCEDECFVINGNSYCESGGPHTEKFENYQGCDSLVQFTVIQLPAMAVIQQPVPPINCNSPALTLSSNGSTTGGVITYNWTNAAWTLIGTQPTQTVTTTGVYHLVVTNNLAGKACKDTTEVTVTGNTTPPGALANGGFITCTVSSVTLQGSSPTNGVNYQWAGPGITPANQFQQNPIVNAMGVYTLSVTNPVNGCISTDTANVSGNTTPPLISAVGDTITCTQPTAVISLSVNVPSATFKWAGPCINASNQTVQNPPVTCPGTFAVTVTNPGNGCTSTTSATVLQNTTVPTLSAGPDQTITCQFPNITLNGSGNAGGAPIQFLWTGAGINAGNQNSPTPTVNQADTYILTVTNLANGCFRKDTAVVGSSTTPPTVNAGLDQTLTCVLQNVTLGGNGSSQGVNFSPLWSGPGINASNQNQYNPVVSLPGTYTFTITNIVNGCVASDAVVISQNIAAPTANAGLDKMLTCSSPNGVTLDGSGSPAGVTFLWTGAGVGANNETLPNPTVSVPDTYTLQVTNPTNGCTATDQAIVTQDANVPTANAGPDLGLNCTVFSVDIDGSGSSSGAGITYQWSGPGISGANATVQSPANITVPGAYSLTVTNTLNNCVNTDVVVIEIDTISPTASAGAPLVLNCYNSSTDTLDASASSSGANFTLIWSGPSITPANQNDLMPIVTLPGIYSITVTNTDNNCSSTAQTNVSQNITPPLADAGADKTIDCVTTSTSIGGNSSSGVSFTYLWTGPDITPANEALAQPVVSIFGNYQLVVTNTVNGCSSSDAVVVNSNAVFPTATAGPDGLLTCAQPAVTLNGSGSSSGAGFQTLWNGPGITPANQNQLSPSIALPGAYILAITNTTNSCVSRDTVVVDENKIVPLASAGQDHILDCQTLDVTLDGSLSDTGTTIVYLWSGLGINAGNQNQQSPNVTQPDTYTLLVTNTANGCTDQDVVIVNQNITLPVASAGNDLTLTCAQNSQAIDGSGSSVGANFTYLWQGSGINSDNFDDQNPVVADSGTYVLIVTNMLNHCTATDNVYVALDGDFPVAEAGMDKILTCQNDTVQLDGSQSQSGAGILYAWSGPGIVAGQQTDQSPFVFLKGDYTLTVTNTNNGCSKTDVVNVGEDFIAPIANAGLNQVLTCANSTTGVTLLSSGSSTGADFGYLWSGPGITPTNQNQPNPTVLVTGAYTLIITNLINGCTSSDGVNVDQDQNLPTANAGPNQTITCSALSVILDGSGSSAPGGGTLQFQWSGPGIAGNQSDEMPSVSVSGSYILTVIAPLSGCQASDNVEVLLDDQPPTLTVTADTITCQDPQADVSVTSSLPNTDYTWVGLSVTQANMHLPTIQVTEAGLYSVTGVAPNGCFQTASITVQIDSDVPDGDAEGTELNCNNNGVSTISGQVNTPGATFYWTGPGGFQSDSLTATVTQVGTYTFHVVSSNGCERPIPVEVTSNFAQPVATAFVSELLDCNTTSVTINASASSTGPIYTYVWSGGNIVSGANTLTPVVDQAAIYKLVISNNINGCKDSVSVEVENDPEVPTAFDLSIQDIKCFGDVNGFVTVNSVAGGTTPFTFSLDGGTGSGNQFTNLSAGDYTLSLEDANGCLLDTTFSISEPGELVVQAGPDVTVQLGEEATVSAEIVYTTPLQSVTWNYAPNCDSLAAQCLTFTYLPLSSYRHEITVRDSNGCVDRDEVLVIVNKKRLIYVPNIFNPDSDGSFNSLLMIHGGTGVVKVRSWQIYDRWGESVFVKTDFPTDDPAYAWDGRARGDEGHTGVYVWFAEIEFVDGEVELFKGDVTIIR